MEDPTSKPHSDSEDVNSAGEETLLPNHLETGERVLYYPDLRKKKGIKSSRADLWRKCRDGQFPPPFKLAGKNAWLERHIDRHLIALAEAARARAGYVDD